MGPEARRGTPGPEPLARGTGANFVFDRLTQFACASCTWKQGTLGGSRQGLAVGRPKRKHRYAVPPCDKVRSFIEPTSLMGHSLKSHWHSITTFRRLGIHPFNCTWSIKEKTGVFQKFNFPLFFFIESITPTV